MNASNRDRRRLIVSVLCGAWLAGCQTPPKPAPVPEKAATLASKGFVQRDDVWELSLGVKLLFEVDDAALSDGGRGALADVVRTLREIGVERVHVEGHTDNVGSAAYNQALSLRRAESVAQQLVTSGWPDAAIQRVGFGLTKPIADNATPEGRAQNRRVVITVPAD
jgi:outer membrane protein OmpA-like peptidoglycan-associated protein